MECLPRETPVGLGAWPGRDRQSEAVLAASATETAARSRPVVQAVLGTACISSSAVLITLASVGPVTTAFYRCALPLPVLGLLAVTEQRRHGPRPLASRGYAVLAGFFLAVNLVLWIHAIADVGAGAATVLGNLAVLFIAPLAWARLHERPGWRYLLTLPVVLLGVVLVSGMIGSSGTGLHPVAGVVYGVATSATYACFLLILRQTAGQARHPAGQLFDATAGAAAGALLLGLAFGGLQLAIPWRSLGWLLLLALLIGIVGWLLITSSLPSLPAALSSLLLLLEPAGAMVLAAIVLGQRPSLIQVAGAVLVCGGVLLATASWPPRVRVRPGARSRTGHASAAGGGPGARRRTPGAGCRRK
jgi:drug/metabolite transporter (DMT)-like permease